MWLEVAGLGAVGWVVGCVRVETWTGCAVRWRRVVARRAADLVVAGWGGMVGLGREKAASESESERSSESSGSGVRRGVDCGDGGVEMDGAAAAAKSMSVPRVEVHSQE